MNRKLGKKPVRRDLRTLQLENYIAHLPIPPDSTDWSSKAAPFPMFLNDKIGDCTCAAAAHMIEVWTKNAKLREVELTDTRVLKAYEDISGYDSDTGENDNGAVELDVLNFWRKRGIGGHRILAYTSINTGHLDNIKTACWLFGGIYVGLELPITAQKQEIWDVIDDGGLNPDSAIGSWGGHAVSIHQYDSDGLTCITWGQLQRMTWQFFRTYCEEAYAVLSRDWLRKNQAPNGFAITELLADLTEVT